MVHAGHVRWSRVSHKGSTAQCCGENSQSVVPASGRAVTMRLVLARHSLYCGYTNYYFVACSQKNRRSPAAALFVRQFA